MAGLSLQELNALTAVAGRRSFRAAAGHLGVSPSALSHQVASVERRLGVRLFNRTTRSVSLTEAGEHFLARVSPALREIADAVETVNRFRDTPAGLLRFNASEGGAERILPTVMDFMAAYPDMRVDLAVDGRMVDIVAEGFDAGVRGGSAVPQDMIALPFGVPETFMIVGSPAYLQAHGRPIAPADLLRHACIRVRMPSGVLLPWDFERRGETVSIEPPGRLVVGSPGLAIQAAVAGGGIAYVIERAMTDELASGRLVRVLEDWTPPFPGVSLYYPRQRLPSAGLAAFIEHFKAARRRTA
ncbi:MAG: LysR family transcriptional regulator [Alphaproteobacteria bacterium]|nr:LysR family transcriptional regulator [Alphaproteobacteria bacterium]MBU1513725.1 LysR family transcriptional regulator [Alphaproteobacteria bacterium]MBU2094630.1 LysR family transcriptional regulator [Alphaproteobacteria bacterium]MBU2150301.1 LysR family transcriptional regulator [Alphaproteobacteria bacterium]MBU2309170.1 LysR family transcriptional regulator [Alphaproteobacteria bacterium]